MDVFLLIETIEIVGILLYVGYTRPHHEDVRTQAGLMLLAGLLAVDVFILRRHRPDWFRDGINLFSVLAWGYYYEKVLGKYIVAVLTLLGR